MKLHELQPAAGSKKTRTRVGRGLDVYKRQQHMVVSALKYGFTKVKFCQKQNNLLRRKKVASNAYSKARKTS